MSKGILVFAFDNSSIDYVKQAKNLAIRASKYLHLPTTIVTDKPLTDDVFDNVITIENTKINKRKYRDGSLSEKTLDFKNLNRCMSYDLSPYNETIVLDSDFVICNDMLNNCFAQQKDLLLYKDAVDLCEYRDTYEFQRINDTGIDFYWATAIFFRKTQENKIFFDLTKHILDNYSHYRALFQLNGGTVRNDFVFSIAAHIINGYQSGNFIGKMPGKLYYTIDRDFIINLEDDKCTFLVQKENRLGEYTLLKTIGANVHVMNKFSLGKVYE